MIKKLFFICVLALGLAQSIHAETVQGMPNMNVDMAEMQKRMAILPFLTAPIESNDKLTSNDVELFLEAVKKKDKAYGKYSEGMDRGYEKAAQVLKEGVSFDTFAKKAIELSGMQSELDKEAQKIGYDNALDLTLKSTRIVRVLMVLEVEKNIAKASKVEQMIMRNMLSGMMGAPKKEDIEVVKPYVDQFEHLQVD
jgi:hypothetical protein